MFQTTFSPDGRWICFNAVRAGDYRTSTLFVVPSMGGPWTQVTEGRFWDDNPRWAPDGNTIYFLSSRARGGLFFGVWGIRFDPHGGRAAGKAFQVTRFDPRERLILMADGLSMTVGRERLVVTISQVSGNVWVLEHP